MKKTYTTPTLLIGGDVVHETLIGNDGLPEMTADILFKHPVVGGVGYYL